MKDPKRPGDTEGHARADADGPADRTDEPAAPTPPQPDSSDDALAALRDRITRLDERLVRLVGERRALVLEIGRVKEALGLPVLDPAREAGVVRRAAELARREGVDEELVRDVIWRIVASARQTQEGRTSWGPPDAPRPDAERGPTG